jgi:hypothetical protein
MRETLKCVEGQPAGADRVRTLTPQSIEAIRASMDASLTRLSQRSHELARRRLEESRGSPGGEINRCREPHCEAVAGLDGAASELELLRGGTIRAFAE